MYPSRNCFPIDFSTGRTAWNWDADIEEMLHTIAVESHQGVKYREDFKPNFLYDRFHFYISEKPKLA
jgi:hypothetical protein